METELLFYFSSLQKVMKDLNAKHSGQQNASSLSVIGQTKQNHVIQRTTRKDAMNCSK